MSGGLPDDAVEQLEAWRLRLIGDAEERGRAAEREDIIRLAREMNYGPRLRTFLKHIARDEHRKPR